MKARCVICSAARGRRSCLLRQQALICPRCCAGTRSLECEGCSYWAQSNAYARTGTAARDDVPLFTARIDPEVEDEVGRALEMVQRGQLQAAERVLAGLLRTDGDIHMVHFGMGVIRVLQERYDEALDCFDTSVAIFPYFVDGWFNKAVTHQKRLEVGPTLRAFQKVIALGDPEDEVVGEARAIVADFDRSIRSEKGFSLDRYVELMDIFDEAFAAMQNRQWDRALAGFRRVAAGDPQGVQVHGNMGLCLASMGRKREALAALDRALEIDPDYEPAKINRRMVLAMTEGETPRNIQSLEVEYYRDRLLQERAGMS